MSAPAVWEATLGAAATTPCCENERLIVTGQVGRVNGPGSQAGGTGKDARSNTMQASSASRRACDAMASIWAVHCKTTWSA
eukprot:11759109-Alexandrium_andersonii.AAC.1